MIKNIFAFIGVLAVLVSILGMTSNPVTPKKETASSQKTTSKKTASNKNIKSKEITETKITMTEEYRQLLKVE